MKPSNSFAVTFICVWVAFIGTCWMMDTTVPDRAHWECRENAPPPAFPPCTLATDAHREALLREKRESPHEVEHSSPGWYWRETFECVCRED